jgi:hypothetical protein
MRMRGARAHTNPMSSLLGVLGRKGTEVYLPEVSRNSAPTAPSLELQGIVDHSL